MEQPKLDRMLECINGDKLIIPNRDDGLPEVMICTGGEFTTPTKPLGKSIGKAIIAILEQEVKGLQIRQEDVKLIVNERLELNVIISQLYDRLNMRWYFYGNNPGQVVKKLLSL